MRLKVESLARIKQAEVVVKDLTIFVGQNSTNKSYMAHVIYELFKEISKFNDSRLVFRSISSISKRIFDNYKEDIAYLMSLDREIEEEILSHQITEDEFEDVRFTIVKIFVNQADEKLIAFLNQILEVVFEDLTLKVNKSFNNNKTMLKKLFIGDLVTVIKTNMLNIRLSIAIEEFNDNNDDIQFRVVNFLVRSLTDKLQNYLNDYIKSYYFPASRTGFVLTLDEIFAGIFRDKFRGQVSATRLGEPTIDFIQTFADIKMGKPDFDDWFNPINFKDEVNDLIKFLENNIIKGTIDEVKNNENYTTYYLKVKGEKLDLHLASSATLETLPFIVFLRNTPNIKKTFFVIEEPEAHLHPKAQIQMARFIVKLVNSGAKVLVTTHSDYILGEINNCIKKFELSEDDISMSKDNVSAYLFRNEQAYTTVKELDIDKLGISDENFNEALDELLENSARLTDKILENE
jgi:predicted ATPase